MDTHVSISCLLFSIKDLNNDCTTSSPAVLGVRRLLVTPAVSDRVEDISARLLNAACTHSIYGTVVPKSQCAFAPQNSSALNLGRMYVCRGREDLDDRFLMYRPQARLKNEEGEEK